MTHPSASTTGLDLALGGPQALLLWKGWRFLPVVGAAIGAATGLVAPFLYLPIAEWFYEMKIPRDLIWFWNDVVRFHLVYSRRNVADDGRIADV